MIHTSSSRTTTSRLVVVSMIASLVWSLLMGLSNAFSSCSLSSSPCFLAQHHYQHQQQQEQQRQQQQQQQRQKTVVLSSSTSSRKALSSSSSSSNGGDDEETTSSTSSSTVAAATNEPELAKSGIYQIKNEDQYKFLVRAHPTKLVVIKFYASYCRACKALSPLFLQVKDDPQLTNLPIVWAEFPSSRETLELFQRLNVLALPTIQFYDGSRGLCENFPCGPAKIPLLKQKLAQFLNTRVDPQTLQLKSVGFQSPQRITQPRAIRDINTEGEGFIKDEHLVFLRSGMPFFQDLTNDEFNTLVSKAKLLTFNPGDLIIRQGMPPTTFYVVKSGKLEMSIKSRFEDPISTPPNYLGVVVNELGKFDYFGERALSTGEPYSATVRVIEKARAFAFDVNDIPESSILSKKRRITSQMAEQLSQRYALPPDYSPPAYNTSPRDQCVLELLVRFKQIRQAAKCFDYVMKKATPKWGDAGEIARRNLLVRKLSKAQVEEFQQVFALVDKNSRGRISLLDMRWFMESARQSRSTAELYEMMARAAGPPNVRVPGARELYSNAISIQISRDEFMGVMAEAEFYNLFTETFTELDLHNTGYVRAGDLDEILGGVRDLISHDKTATNLIDVEDKDMLVDYEQFSKMLLGAAL